MSARSFVRREIQFTSRAAEIRFNVGRNAKMLYSRMILAQLMLLVLRQAHVITSYTHENSNLSRNKRYLVFPLPTDVATSKVQLIAGLGIPMEVEASTIIGVVTKFNYLLPTNASYITDPYVRYVRSTNKISKTHSQDALFSRYELYKMITNAINGFQMGKACLLKIICEFAEIPLSKESGIAAELLHSLITPSTSLEQIKDPEDQVYLAAEMLGRSKLPGQCKANFPECENNILEYFTEIQPY